MKERIAKLLGNGIESRLILGTFHSVCRRYLVTYGHLIGIPKDFGIADSSDSLNIIKRIIKHQRLNIDPKMVQARISNSKSKGIDHAELAHGQGKKNKEEQQEFVIVFEAYQDQLARSNLLDYDDLLLRCVDLLRQHPTCVSNVEVVLIDEFQDTNIVQFDLMRLFAAKNKRITTVGDPDQSIYGWRSAEVRNLTRMQQQYPDTLVIHLEENYRSSGAILLAAHQIIEQDESRPSKNLLPTHCPGTVPVLRRLPSAEVEASWIVSEIQRAGGLTGHVLAHSDFAILLRSASLSRHIESALGKAGIPYRMVGGQRFFDRVEVKILLDYLRVISQPHNNDALSRIINIPTRGIGTTTAKGLLEEAEAKKLTLWTLIREAVQSHSCAKTKISKAAEQGLGSLINIILTSRNKLVDLSHPQSPEDLLKYVIKRLDFESYLAKNYLNDHESRWSNVGELVAQAAEYPAKTDRCLEDEKAELPVIEGLDQREGNPAEDALSKFLANVALATEIQREEEDNEGSTPQLQVTISTIHAAKGLEWPVVFVPSVYEGCIPHSRAEDTDEERRLLYVAMTRAQALLYTSCPTKNSQREETTLSQFLSSKKVSHFLTNKGPPISTGTVSDICRILRRGYPTQTEIADACSKLRNVRDNLWPLNGEEEAKPMQDRWSRWDEYDTREHNFKKRRLKGSEEVVKDSHNALIDGVKLPPFSSIGSTTTMQNSSTFSYNGTKGFTTAAMQLENDIEEAKAVSLRQVSEMRPKSEKQVQKLKRTTSDSQSGSQSSLLSLWSKNVNPHTGRDEPAGCRYPTGVERNGRIKVHNQLPFQSTATATTYARGSDATIAPVIRQPLAAIPQTLATHRLQHLPKSNRPRLDSCEDASRKKQYVFLSSSPPPIEGSSEGAEKQSNEPLQPEEAVTGLGDKNAVPMHTESRPARTMHATSVSQIQTAPTGVKKTLGVRRRMTGWAPRPSQGFSVPQMTSSKT